MVYAVTGLFVLGLVGAGIWWSTAASSNHSGASGTADSSATGEAFEEADDPDGERAVLDQTKIVVSGLLDIISQSVGSFIERSETYDGEIDTHRDQIERATSLQNLKSIEQELLSNLDALQSANTSYRQQLDEAKQQLAAQKAEMERLKIDVTTDFLTNLPNRRALDKRLRENVDRSNRYGTKFSMIVVDIDHFKAVNDSYGHVAGDRVIRAIGTIFSEEMRSTDFLARYGGEEFVMILPETTEEQAVKTAERMRSRVESAVFRYSDQGITVTVSLGVGEVYQPEDSAENFFERVDAALYKAKDAGRNRVESTL